MRRRKMRIVGVIVALISQTEACATGSSLCDEDVAHHTVDKALDLSRQTDGRFDTALALCRDGNGIQEGLLVNRIHALDVGAPRGNRNRVCFYVEMAANLPVMQRQSAQPVMMDLAYETDFSAYGSSYTSDVPPWLRTCPASLGENAWWSVWRFAGIDSDLVDDDQRRHMVMSQLKAVCAAPRATLFESSLFQELDDADGKLRIFALRLQEATIGEEAQARWQLVEMIARLWTHSDGIDRQQISAGLSGSGPDLWDNLARWRDMQTKDSMPPTANFFLLLHPIIGYNHRQCVADFLSCLSPA